MLIFSGDNKLIDLPLELFHSLYPIFLSLTLSNSSFSANPSRPTIHPFISPHRLSQREGLQVVMDVTYITVHGIVVVGYPTLTQELRPLSRLPQCLALKDRPFLNIFPISFFLFFCLPWFLFTARAVSKVANFGIRLFISVPAEVFMFEKLNFLEKLVRSLDARLDV